MANQEPEANGALPPKISLKPKLQSPAAPQALPPNPAPAEQPEPIAKPSLKPAGIKPISLTKSVSPIEAKPAETQPITTALPPAPAEKPQVPAERPAPAEATQDTSAPNPTKPILRKPVLSSAPKPFAPKPISLAKPAAAAPKTVTIQPQIKPVEAKEEPVTPTEIAPKPTEEPVTTIEIAKTMEEPVVPIENTEESVKPTEEAPTLSVDMNTETAADSATDSATVPEEAAVPPPPPTPMQEQEADTAPAAPKRPVLRPLGSAPGAAKKPVPLGIPKTTPDALAAPGTKQSTSRITLPPANEKATTGQIKTIKIPPRPQSGKIEDIEGAPVEEAATPAAVADPKRQTSRISLESVLGSNQPAATPATPSAPATIKIKRAPIAGKASDLKTQIRPPSSPPEQEETTSEDAPESQKKTLKVKRASSSQTHRPALSGSAGSSPMFTPPVASQVSFAPPEPHWSFAIVGIAATLVASFLLYLMGIEVAQPDLIEQTPTQIIWQWPSVKSI